MRVIINQNPLFLTKDKWFSDFAHNMLMSVFHRHINHHFLYLTFDIRINTGFPSNVECIKVFQPRLLPFFLKRWWYKRKAISLAKELNADLIISFQDYPLNAIIPEYIIALSNAFSVANIPASTHIIVSSVLVKEQLKRDGFNEDRIKLIRPFVDQSYTPLDFDSMKAIKARFAAGKEFFLFDASGAPDDFIIHVLKAFSVFKKWQQSNAQLIIINAELHQQTTLLLQTYKHRQDMHLPENTDKDRCALMASATTVIYLPASDNFGLALMEALYCEVPVITHNAGALAEIGGDAVLYTDPGDLQNIADKMMKIFKDEKLRSQLIQKTKTQCMRLKTATTFML
jgi:glycosyltransferase involved in cell wall biosynthesis